MSEKVGDALTASAAPPKPAGPREGRARRWLRWALVRLAALAFGGSVAAVLAELLVLVVLGEHVKFPRHVVEAPWGLRYNQPGSHYRHRSADGTWYFCINALGMRADRDFAYQKPPGVKRIISLGDSFTIGYEVDPEQTFSSVLERELNRAGLRVEVLNAGISGASNAEECLYLERELLKYDPDLVLVSFYGNDLQDNIRTGLFRLEGDELVPWRKSYVPAGRLGNFLNSNTFFNLLSERSNAFAFVKEQLTLLAKWKLVRENERQLAAAAEEPADALVADPGTEVERRMAAAIFERMYRNLHARGIPLVIQSIPTMVLRPEPHLVELFPLDQFPTDRPGLAFFPARKALGPYVGQKLLYWLRSQSHWTPLSHEQSGKGLAELIQSRGLLGTPSSACEGPPLGLGRTRSGGPGGAIPELAKLLKDPDAGVQRAAAAALRALEAKP